MKKKIIIGLIGIMSLVNVGCRSTEDEGYWHYTSNGTGYYIGGGKELEREGINKPTKGGDFGYVEEYIDPDFYCDICEGIGTCIEEDDEVKIMKEGTRTKECKNEVYCNYCRELIYKNKEEVIEDKKTEEIIFYYCDKNCYEAVN